MKFQLQQLPSVENIKKIFFVGIKGVGVAPLAIIAKEAGFDVAGSDVDEEFITDKYLNNNEITLYKNFNEEDIKSFFGETNLSDALLITTGAHKGFDNPQVVWAKNNSVRILTQGQALALFMESEIFGRHDSKGISIAGSHGKTTITSLLATTMKAIGLDPSYSIGTGEVFPLGAPGHYGRGEFFIAEADEYASEPVYDRVPKFLYQEPYYAIFNNIDFDHPDLFKNISEIEESFEEFAHNIKSGGTLFINGDDELLIALKERIKKDIKIITFGGKKSNDYVAAKIVSRSNFTQFSVFRNSKELGVFEINLLGEHNAYNALSVISLLTELGYAPSKIRLCLKAFEGSKRRSEVVGNMEEGAIVIDDYGHHPLEITTTIHAIKKSHEGKKVICIFQPHTYSRTRVLLEEFGAAFKEAHALLLLPVFKSARDTELDTISSEEILRVHEKYVTTNFFENFADMVEYVRQNYSTDDYVVLTMGAGDVYKIAERLVVKRNNA